MFACCFTARDSVSIPAHGGPESNVTEILQSGNDLPLGVAKLSICVRGREINYADSSLAGELLHQQQLSLCLESTSSPERITDRLKLKLRVDYSELTFHQLIGKGSFKAVYRGRWNNTSIAILCMRKGGMVTEAHVLQRMSNHPNLVQFYRWATDKDNNEYMIMEHVRGGSLDKLLLSRGKTLGMRVKLAICEQICSAMCELSSENVIHRDLAVRNILVADLDPVHVKVTDFGLARVRGSRLASAQDVSIPLRWSPPEVLLEYEWSEKSDVWSFGVTMWEIFTGGDEPFAQKTDAEAYKAIISHAVLPRPHKCPRQVYLLMIRCWDPDPASRPKFDDILKVFKKWRVASLMRNKGSSVPAANQSAPARNLRQQAHQSQKIEEVSRSQPAGSFLQQTLPRLRPLSETVSAIPLRRLEEVRNSFQQGEGKSRSTGGSMRTPGIRRSVTAGAVCLGSTSYGGQGAATNRPESASPDSSLSLHLLPREDRPISDTATIEMSFDYEPSIDPMLSQTSGSLSTVTAVRGRSVDNQRERVSMAPSSGRSAAPASAGASADQNTWARPGAASAVRLRSQALGIRDSEGDSSINDLSPDLRTSDFSSVLRPAPYSQPPDPVQGGIPGWLAALLDSTPGAQLGEAIVSETSGTERVSGRDDLSAQTSSTSSSQCTPPRVPPPYRDSAARFPCGLITAATEFRQRSALAAFLLSGSGSRISSRLSRSSAATLDVRHAEALMRTVSEGEILPRVSRPSPASKVLRNDPKRPSTTDDSLSTCPKRTTGYPISQGHPSTSTQHAARISSRPRPSQETASSLNAIPGKRHPSYVSLEALMRAQG